MFTLKIRKLFNLYLLNFPKYLLTHCLFYKLVKTTYELQKYCFFKLTMCIINSTECDFFQLTKSYEYLYENLCRYFLTWYLPTVITLGFVGSIFCLFFLLRSHLFPPNLQIWLISICVGDFFILIMEGIWMLLKIWFKYDIRDPNNFMCIFHTSISNYLFYWSAYMQSLLSVQRCYLVLCPLKVKSQIIQLSRLTIYQMLISLFLILPILPYPIYWRIINHDCDPITEHIFRLTTLCDLIFWGLIPVSVMTTCTGIICRNLFKRNRSVNFTSKQKRLNKLKTNALDYKCIRCQSNSSLYYNIYISDHKNSTEDKLNTTRNINSHVNNKKLYNCNLISQRRRFYSFPENISNLVEMECYRKKNQDHSITKLANNTACINENINNKANLTNVRTTTNDDGSNSNNANQINNNKKNSQSQNLHTDEPRKRILNDGNSHITPVLVCMNLVYMASVCPLIIYFVFLNFIITNIDKNLHKFFYYLFRSLCLLNTCTNWIFYCIAGRMFRDKTKQLLTSLCCPTKRYKYYNENGYLIIKYSNQCRYSVTNITRISTTKSTIAS